MESEKPLRRSQRKVKRKETPSSELPNDFTTPRQWSKLEKSQLLAALEKFDETDIASISQYIPTKNCQQIESYIRNVKKKAVSLTNKNITIKELGNWIKFVNRSNTNTDACRYDPLTIPLFLISVFESFPNPSSCDGIDFKAAYEFIFCIMAEIPPKPVNRKTMQFISKSFSEMGLMMSENNDMKTFIKEKLKENMSLSDELLKDDFNPLVFPKIILALSKE